MAVNSKDIVMAAVGFLLVALMTPIGMTIIVAQNGTFNTSGTTATYASTYTIFTVLVPILYIIGAALYFIPKVNE